MRKFIPLIFMIIFVILYFFLPINIVEKHFDILYYFNIDGKNEIYRKDAILESSLFFNRINGYTIISKKFIPVINRNFSKTIKIFDGKDFIAYYDGEFLTLYNNDTFTLELKDSLIFTSKNSNLMVVFEKNCLNFSIYKYDKLNRVFKIIKKYNYYQIFSDIYISENYIGISFFNGEIFYYNSFTGEPHFFDLKKISLIKNYIIYSIAITDSGLIGIIAGFEPQYFLILNTAGELVYFNKKYFNDNLSIIKPFYNFGFIFNDGDNLICAKFKYLNIYAGKIRKINVKLIKIIKMKGLILDSAYSVKDMVVVFFNTADKHFYIIFFNKNFEYSIIKWNKEIFKIHYIKKNMFTLFNRNELWIIEK